MTLTFKWLLCFAICGTLVVLISNVFRRNYTASFDNILALGACLFLLGSQIDTDCLCMPKGPEQTAASETQSILLGDRKTDSSDYTSLGTVESQLSLQMGEAERLEERMLSCEGAASFCDKVTIGSALAASPVPSSPISSVASRVAAVSQGFSQSYASTGTDCERALATTRETIAQLEKTKPS